MRTGDEVTDDPSDYLPRRSNYNHSHIYPQLDKELVSSSRKTDTARKSSKNIQINKLYHGSQTDINAGRTSDANAESNVKKTKDGLEMEHKVLLNIASTSKLEE